MISISGFDAIVPNEWSHGRQQPAYGADVLQKSAQGDDIVPIPGTRNATRLAENVSAAEVGMGSADLDRIREILPHGAFGSRYPASMMPKW